MTKSALVSIALLALVVTGSAQISSREQERLTKEVRKKLVTLPYYSVFDNLEYSMDGPNVTLLGQTPRPSTKDDAARAVKRIEGIGTVTNNIEVLPVSPNDDRIRRAVYKAVYRLPGFKKYSNQPVPPIHIIVKNGNVTLVGAVGNQGDKERVGITVNSVPGVFSVTNNLIVDKS
jgi:hyperosmotically inducible protein